MKSIKLSSYFQVIHPKYVFLKLTPMNSIRNYNSNKIAKAIASLYKSVMLRIRNYNKQYFFEAPSKISYFIYLEKNKVEFYFIVPDIHLTLIKEKIGDCWHGITITIVDCLPCFSQDAIKYKLTYRKEDALSLAIDYRTNTLLSSILNVIDIIEDSDKVGVFYNFIPVSQFSWRSEYERTIKKLNNNIPIDKEKLSINYAIKIFINVILEICNIFMEVTGSVFGDKKEEQKYFTLPMLQQTKAILPATTHKKEAQILQTQMVVLSESTDRNRGRNTAYSVCEAFKSISGDNEIVYKRQTGKVDFLEYQLHGVDIIKTSPEECQNFISLPGRELLEEHKIIDSVNTFESEVPEELQKGKISVGENTYRGIPTKAYLTTDKEYKNLALVIIGPTRAGKTTLIANISNDSVSSSECTILFDFCGNCELSQEVAAKVQKQKLLIIDCEDNKTLQGLGYNEVNNTNTDTFKRYRNAKVQVSQLMTLVNALNNEDKELAARMERYMGSAALIVFLAGGSIKDVFSALQNHITRSNFINMIPDDQNENVEEYIENLKEIDETDKKTGEVIGTKYQSVSGILDRINKLKQNTYMELMLKKDCSTNINLVEEIQKSQLICLRMPEIMFSTEAEKDIYCTYWMTKIWLALQMRKWEIPNNKHVNLNIIVDELYQIPKCQDFIRSKLSQMAKFRSKMIISCHYLGQIDIIRNELKAANSSYMLISGCDKDNYRELKDELYPYTMEDMLNLKRFHCLNYLKYEKGYAKFITKLPKPL